MSGLSRKSIERLLDMAVNEAMLPEENRFLERCRAALLPQEKRATRGRGARAKGKHAELEVVQLLRPFFPGCKRGYQTRGGGKEQADVIETDPFHVEVKRKESLNLYDALEQAIRDAGEGKIPLVLHRRNDRPWVAILTAEAFLDIFRRSDLCGMDDPAKRREHLASILLEEGARIEQAVRRVDNGEPREGQEEGSGA